MSQRVLCVMLANGRQEMVQRAIRSFASQTYQHRKLLIFDSGADPLPSMSIAAGGGHSFSEGYYHQVLPDGQVAISRGPVLAPDGYIHQVRYQPGKPISIGSLRNVANGLATGGALDCDLIAHWDSDDYSHPDRLTEQVAMMEATGADCVGYRDMLFWRTSRGDPSEVIHCACGNDYDRHMLTVCPECSAWPDPHRGEGWQFRSPNPAYILGTSMLYTRKIWERFPFQDRAAGEDTLWLMERRIKRETTSSLSQLNPRMIAGLHGGNTCSMVKPGAVEWTRAERWDEFCRETMKL